MKLLALAMATALVPASSLADETDAAARFQKVAAEVEVSRSRLGGSPADEQALLAGTASLLHAYAELEQAKASALRNLIAQVRFARDRATAGGKEATAASAVEKQLELAIETARSRVAEELDGANLHRIAAVEKELEELSATAAQVRSELARIEGERRSRARRMDEAESAMRQLSWLEWGFKQQQETAEVLATVYENRAEQAARKLARTQALQDLETSLTQAQADDPSRRLGRQVSEWKYLMDSYQPGKAHDARKVRSAAKRLVKQVSK